MQGVHLLEKLEKCWKSWKKACFRKKCWKSWNFIAFFHVLLEKLEKDLFSNIYFHYHFCFPFLFLLILFSTLFLTTLSIDSYLFIFVSNNNSILGIGENDYKDFLKSLFKNYALCWKSWKMIYILAISEEKMLDFDILFLQNAGKF